ncbi:MAG: hypothetical protein ACKVZ6_21900 [Kineosporiaceae bacterium]
MQRFRFDFALPFSLPLRFLGIRPGSASVDVGDDHLAVSFGPWHLVTPLANVEDVRVTGPYNPLKAYGVRVSLSDLGVTFGTASAGGVCISFREPVAAAFPGGLVRHPSLTVTVDDPERLRRVLLHEAHAPRPVLAAVADVPSRPDAEPDEEDRRARDRAVRQARKAARKRAEQRVAEREEAERATARRSAAGKRGAAKRAQARTEGQRPTKKSDRQRPSKKAASARGTSTRTRTPAQRVTAVSGSANRATGTVTRTANTSKNRSATR